MKCARALFSPADISYNPTADASINMNPRCSTGATFTFLFSELKRTALCSKTTVGMKASVQFMTHLYLLSEELGIFRRAVLLAHFQPPYEASQAFG